MKVATMIFEIVMESTGALPQTLNAQALKPTPSITTPTNLLSKPKELTQNKSSCSGSATHRGCVPQVAAKRQAPTASTCFVVCS